jgi:peptidyl-prolyl cis-trans isomerase SurA
MRQSILIGSIVLASFLPMAAHAVPNAELGAGIAAVANGDAISVYDVESRIKFIIVTTKLSNTPEVLQRIRPQIIRSLIDEKLEIQEATKNDIKVTDDDIKKAIANIEAERNMPPGAIDHILEQNNVPKSTFTQQIHAQLAWSKLLIKKIKPTVHVTDEDIAVAAKKMSLLPAAKPKGKGPQESKIAVITLPVDKASRESEMKKLGEKLVKEVRSGASFEEVSRQFSSSTADAGGKVEAFWISPSQLDPHVAAALTGASAGAITDPVRTAEGYVIIKVYDTRAAGGKEAEPEQPNTDTQVTLKEILLKLKASAPDKDANMLLQIAEDVVKHPGSCQDKSVAGINNTDDLDIETNMRTAFLSDLPPAIRTIAETLHTGDISTPFASNEGIRLYMLCDKKENMAKTPDHEQVFHVLLQQKMELEAQKYLRNLRREGFIEIR